MRIAVVNPFDPLPGEGFRLGRYGFLCRALAARGHQVHWYSSSFWHEFKRSRDAEAIYQAARQAGYVVTLVSAPQYSSNVSWSRLRSHAALARRLRKTWLSQPEPPDVVLVSLPPPAVAKAAAEWADRIGAKLVVDIQDLWPDALWRFWPKGLRWLNALALAGMARNARFAYGRAQAVTGVARGYVQHAAPFVSCGALTATLHLGVDLATFDAGVRPLDQIGLTKPAGEKWLFLGGALRKYLDLRAAVDLMAELHRRGRDDVQLVVVGARSTQQRLEEDIARRKLGNIRLLGYRPYDEFASIAVACDAALCPIRPDSLIFFPNRVFDYFAAGLPILNTTPGELAEALAEHDAGLTCEASDPAALADAAERLLAKPGRIEGDHRRRRGRWVQEYDRSRIIDRFVEILEAAG